jgi:thiamine pyrophosphate-dependent acetolactate synthase large subunit-like protein
LLRAYRIAVTDPQGPVYVCFDIRLQEQELVEPFTLPDAARYRPAFPLAPDPGALREVAERLVRAERPVVCADRTVGRSVEAVRTLVELAELLALPVVDRGTAPSFPTPHPLDFAGIEPELLAAADVVLGLDVTDLFGTLRLGADRRDGRHQTVISITPDELIHRGLMTDYEPLPTVDLPLLASPAAALPLLLEECRSRLDAAARQRIETRRQALDARQAQLRESQRRQVDAARSGSELTEARLLAEGWEAVKDEDYFVTLGKTRRLNPGLWHIPGPERSSAGGAGIQTGGGGGSAVGSGPGVVLGAALALRDSGKLPVGFLGDGDSLMSNQALWTAAHYQVPLLWVVSNNRSYYNDEAFQARLAQRRDRPPENAWIATRIENPEVDFATVARGMGVYGEGPIKQPGELGPALRRAVEVVKRGEPAIVDVWTANRDGGD